MQGVNQGEYNWCMFGMRCRVCCAKVFWWFVGYHLQWLKVLFSSAVCDLVWIFFLSIFLFLLLNLYS